MSDWERPIEVLSSSGVKELRRLQAENAKLRELVRKLHDELVSCEEKEIICGGHKFDKDVRELGIEVEE